MRKKAIDIETNNVEGFRDAREKFLQQRREEDEKLVKAREEQAKRQVAPPVPGRIFKMNRGGSSGVKDRNQEKKVFPAYFSQKGRTLTVKESDSQYLDMSMSSTLSNNFLSSNASNFGKSPFKSFDAKRGSPDKTKIIQQTFKRFQERLAMRE